MMLTLISFITESLLGNQRERCKVIFFILGIACKYWGLMPNVEFCSCWFSYLGTYSVCWEIMARPIQQVMEKGRRGHLIESHTHNQCTHLVYYPIGPRITVVYSFQSHCYNQTHSIFSSYLVYIIVFQCNVLNLLIKIET